MHTLPASQFIFPDPIEVDPEGEGLICVGADLSHDLSVDNYGVGANGKGNLKIAAGVYNVFFNDITGEFVFVAVE